MGPSDPPVKKTREHSAAKQLWPNRGRHNAFPLLGLGGKRCSFCVHGADVNEVGLLKVLPWVVDGAGGLGAGKTSGAGTRGVSLNVAIGGRTGYSDTNGGESSNN